MEIPEHASDEGLERILVVVAHPDDIDFGTAGSVAAWTARGIAVTYCLVTSGEAGGDDRMQPRAHMAAVREQEQAAAAGIVGVTDVRFLHYPDGRVEPTLELRCAISRVIRDVRPQRVVTQSPERLWDRIYASHPDHLAAAEATVAAVYPDSRNPFAHPELLLVEELEPWSVSQLWMMARPDANVYVDISGVIDRKLAALRSHESQIADPVGIEKLLRDWAQANARVAGLADGAVAELFRAVDTR